MKARSLPRSGACLVPDLVLLMLALAQVVPAHADDVPRVDFDTATRMGLGRAVELPATRARWMIRPSDVGAAEALIGDAGVELIARIARLDDLWVLEAPIDSALAVETRWSGLGTLHADVSGEPSLLESTQLVGVRDRVWENYGLRGDITSSIAILDSGCDTAHDDLGDPDRDDEDVPPLAGDDRDWADAAVGFSGDPQIRVVGWHDVTDDLPLALGPWDYHFHGTALAGAALGGGEVDAASQGVAPQGRIVVVKTWNYEDRWERWASDLLLGMEWVVQNAETYRIRAVLVGVVWPVDLGFGPMIEALRAQGVAVIAPAGNNGVELGHPGATSGVITVGATDDDGRVTAYSAPASVELPATTLDLVAPGGSVLDPAQSIVVADNEPDDGYRGRVGTSLAAAHVAGAVSLINQALVESGRSWRRDAAQVSWLGDLLRITTAEVAAAEPGALVVPIRNRFGADRAEGHGLLQVPTAVDAVRRILWPGSSANFALDAPRTGAASWAARIPTRDDRPFEAELVVPATGDYDLLLYAEHDDGFELIAASTHSGLGGLERVRIERPRTEWSLVVVRRATGSGLAELRTRSELLGGARWPVTVRSVQRSAPAVADLDGDGRDEVVVINNAENDATVHNFHAWRDDGLSFGFFPLTVFSSGRSGQLTTPAIGALDGELAIVAGSEFGDVYAVRPSSDLRWVRTVSSGPTTVPLLAREGGSDRVVVGVSSGVAILSGAGALLRTLPTGAPVTRAVAAGDLDGDGVDELVAVDGNGKVHAMEFDGAPLAGWPLSLAGTLVAPVLLGADDGGAVREILVVERDAQDALWLHRIRPDASAVSGSPIALATGGDPVISVSAPAVVPMVRGAERAVVIASMSGELIAPLRVWRHIVQADGSVESAFAELASAVAANSFLLLSDILLAEPRVADLRSGGDREVLVAVRAGWTVLRQPDFIRSGGFAGYVEFPSTGAPRLLPLTADRNQVGSAGLVAPTFTDLDRDGRPEWIVSRDREIHVVGSRLPEALDSAWTEDRGSTSRRGCVGCVLVEPVAAPVSPIPRLSLEASPNPFNPRLELRALVPRSGELVWEVYDARGRRVRSWTTQASGSGVQSTLFDAIDPHGEPLASGVYLVSLRFANEQVVESVVLVR